MKSISSLDSYIIKGRGKVFIIKTDSTINSNDVILIDGKKYQIRFIEVADKGFVLSNSMAVVVKEI